MVLIKNRMPRGVMTTLLDFLLCGTAFAEGTKHPHKKAIKAMEVHFQNSPETSAMEPESARKNGSPSSRVTREACSKWDLTLMEFRLVPFLLVQ